MDWSQDRYDEIVDSLKPFLASAGFAAAKTVFLPLAAMDGINVMSNENEMLKAWYNGPTLMDALGKCCSSTHMQRGVRRYDIEC